MDITASTITVVSSSWTIAIRVKQLIVRIRHHDEGVKELEHKADTLTAIIGEVRNAYGPEKDEEDQIHQIVAKVISRLEHDLTSFEKELLKLLDEKKSGRFRAGFILRTWREEVAAPTFARLEKSMGSHQDSLQLLLNLLHGRRLDAGLAEVRASNDRMLAMFQALAPGSSLRRRNSDTTLVASSELTELEDQTTTATQDPAFFQQLFAAWVDQMAAEKRPSISSPDTSLFSPKFSPPPADGLMAFQQAARKLSTSNPDPIDFCHPLTPTTSWPQHALENPATAFTGIPPYSNPSPTKVKDRTASFTSQSSSMTVIESIDSSSNERGDVVAKTTGQAKPRSARCAYGMQLLKAIQEDREDRTDTLEPLVKSKASLEAEDDKQRTPLLVATVSAKPQTVMMLLGHGADLEAADNTGKTALHLACEKAGIEVISSLLKACVEKEKAEHSGKIVNAKDNKGRTALHYCAHRDMGDGARLLADYDAEVNAKDNGGYPPVYFAIKFRNYATVDLLLERGASIDAKCNALGTSAEIKKLLERCSNGYVRQNSISDGARRGSTSTSSGEKKPFLSMRRKSSAKT